jgi:hypothetical protein
MKGAKHIPIAAARHIAKLYGQHEVVIVTFDRQKEVSHVITYGKTIEQCEAAAQWGNLIKKHILGWPERLCHATPRRVKKQGRAL